MLFWIDPAVSTALPLCLDPAVYGFSEGLDKLSKRIDVCLLHLHGAGLSHHYFCTCDKTPSAPECRHAERNPFVHLLKGGGLTSEGGAFQPLGGERREAEMHR